MIKPHNAEFPGYSPLRDSSPAAYQVHSILTEVLSQRIRKRCSGMLLKLEIRNVVDLMANDFEAEILFYVQKVDKDVKVPLTWWDHFKLTYFKGKLLERFPVQYRTIHARVLFPDMPVDLARRTNTITYVVKK